MKRNIFILPFHFQTELIRHIGSLKGLNETYFVKLESYSKEEMAM